MINKSLISSTLILFTYSIYALEHVGVVSDFKNSMVKLTIPSDSITPLPKVANGTKEDNMPGIYLQTTADGELVSEKELKTNWIKYPKDIESQFVGKQILREAKRKLPLRVLFKERKGEEAAEKITALLKASPDKFQISFDAKNGESRFTEIETPISAFADGTPEKGGKLKYRQMEYVLPESAVKIKNLKTGEVIALSDLIDRNVDRTWETALTNSINGWLGKFAGEEKLNNTGRASKSPMDTATPQTDSSKTDKR